MRSACARAGGMLPAADALRLRGHGVRHRQRALPPALVPRRRLPPAPRSAGRVTRRRTPRRPASHSRPRRRRRSQGSAPRWAVQHGKEGRGGAGRGGAGRGLRGYEAVGRAAAPVAQGDEGHLFSDYTRIIHVSDSKEGQGSRQRHNYNKATQNSSAAPCSARKEPRLVIVVFAASWRGILLLVVVNCAVFFGADVRISTRFTQPSAQPEVHVTPSNWQNCLALIAKTANVVCEWHGITIGGGPMRKPVDVTCLTKQQIIIAVS